MRLLGIAAIAVAMAMLSGCQPPPRDLSVWRIDATPALDASVVSDARTTPMDVTLEVRASRMSGIEERKLRQALAERAFAPCGIAVRFVDDATNTITIAETDKTVVYWFSVRGVTFPVEVGNLVRYQEPAQAPPDAVDDQHGAVFDYVVRRTAANLRRLHGMGRLEP